MPYIQAKLTVSLNEEEQNKLVSSMINIVSEEMSKPKNYIMTNIETNQKLWMSNKQIEKGAYISISLLGSTTKPVCNNVSQKICNLLNTEYAIDGNSVYITFHPVELWSLNGQMF